MKHTLSIIAITLCIGNAKSQDNSNELDNRAKLQLGAKIGANYSNVYDTQGEDFTADPKLGLATGVFICIPIGTYLGVQPEVIYSQKGFQGSGSILGSKYEFKRTTTYIDVPLMFAFKPSEFLTIVAGPYYSYLIKQKDEFTSTAVSYMQEQEFKNDNIRKNNFGLMAGIDININHFTIGLRVAGDSQTNNGDGTSSTPRYKNVWYQGTIGYKLFKK